MGEPKPEETVEIIRSRGALEALAVEWDALADSMGTPLLGHAWFLSCSEAFYREDELFVVTVRVRGVLVGIAPLVAVERAGIRRLELMGVSYLYEPSGLLYRSEEGLDALVRAVVNTGRPVVLSRLPSDSPIIPRLRHIARGRGLVVARPAAGAVAVPIASGWEEYVARLSSRRRYDLRRARQRAEEAGKVTVRIFCPRPDEVEAEFAELVRVEAAGWKDRGGSSLKQRDALRLFFSRYTRRASESGILRLCFLDLDGKPIAAQLSVEYSERFWVLKIGYDEAWSRCSPGGQLLAETMRYAFDRGLKSYELLGSDEPWLRGWVSETRSYSVAGCYPTTVRGMYGLAADAVGMLRTRVGPRS